MQPIPRGGKNWQGRKRNKPVVGRPVVDPRPGNRGPKGPVVDPRPGKGVPIKAPKAKGPIVKPLPISGDDKIIRTMPITEKQLGQIKKYYGIK